VGNVTGYLACISVAEKSGSSLRSPEVYSAYINMKNQLVNEHTCFRVAKFPAFDAQTIDLIEFIDFTRVTH
jgi:hypothetical protein